MREYEWDSIEVGDVLLYWPTPTLKLADPASVRFMVAQLEAGTGHVIAIRLLSNRDDGVASFSLTETVRITKNSDSWEYVRGGNMSAKMKVVLSGGFEVTRADGSKEYDKCLTPRDKAKAKANLS